MPDNRSLYYHLKETGNLDRLIVIGRIYDSLKTVSDRSDIDPDVKMELDVVLGYMSYEIHQWYRLTEDGFEEIN